MKIKCTNCGNIVCSDEISNNAVIRAYIECPECIDKNYGVEKLAPDTASVDYLFNYFYRFLLFYQNETRHYHSLAHILDCIRNMQDVLHLVHDQSTLRFAIWFHDCVYDATRDDNELRSAVEAVKRAAHLGYSVEFAAKVHRLIMATTHNQETHPPQTRDEELMCDIDLVSLASPREQFMENTRLIRLEYAHVSDEMFYPARKAIFQKFLKRPNIYYTQYFREKYEELARANLINAVL